MFITFVTLLALFAQLTNRNFAAIYENTYLQQTLERRSLVLFYTLQVMLFNLFKRTAYLHSLLVSGLFQDAASTVGSEHNNLLLAESLYNLHRVIVFCVWKYLNRLFSWLDILFSYRAFQRSLHFYYGAAHAIFQIFG